MGVFLRCGEAGMAQKFLDGTEIGAVGQQVGGVGVTKTVRMHGGIAGREQSVMLHETADLPVAQPCPAAVEENGALSRGCDAVIRDVV